MSDNFLIEVLKNPFSAPALILIQLFLGILIILKIKLEIIKDFFKEKKEEKLKKVCLFTLAFLCFLFSSFLLFYKLTDVPPSGYEADQGSYAVGGFIIKNTSHDSLGKKVPYYPFFHLKYHNEIVGGYGTRGIAIYYQAFLQHFVKPGYYSVVLECALLTLLASIGIIFSFYFFSGNIISSFFCGALFNILPWTQILGRIILEATAYEYASSFYLFSLFYLISKKNILGFIFYIISLSILLLSYPPGLLLAPLCIGIIPFVLNKHSNDLKPFAKKLLVLTVIFIFALFSEFQSDGGFKESLGRAQYAQGIEGIGELNLTKIVNSLSNKVNIYLANYTAYLLPQFLFFTGDSNLRHNTGFGGQIFVSLIFAFYIGLVYLITQFKKDIFLKLLLVYFFLTPIPAAICLEGSLDAAFKLPLHAGRVCAMLPPLTIIVFLGLIQILKKNKYLFLAYLVLIGINAKSFYNDFFYKYPYKTSVNAFDEPTIKEMTRKSYKLLSKYPSRTLFYSCPTISFAYHNLDKIKINDLLNGGGVLSNVYHVYDVDRIGIRKRDLFGVGEPFDQSFIRGRKFRYLVKLQNSYVNNPNYGASIIEITE